MSNSIIKNSTSLKAKLSNIAKRTNIPSQTLIQIYMLERFLERVAISRYQDNFILKGGMLIASMLGLDTRATMDMDTTIRGFSLQDEQVLKLILDEIIKIDVGDNIEFSITSLKSIRKEDKEGGIRALLLACLDKMRVDLQIDVTTGDKITYKEIDYEYNLLLENRKINILSYNLETILAEKYHSTIIRGITNTRIRDYYDMYILTTLKKDSISKKTLFDAINETAKHKGGDDKISDQTYVTDTINDIEDDIILKKLWKIYQDKNNYAKGISYEQLIESIRYIKDLYFNERD